MISERQSVITHGNIAGEGEIRGLAGPLVPDPLRIQQITIILGITITNQRCRQRIARVKALSDHPDILVGRPLGGVHGRLSAVGRERGTATIRNALTRNIGTVRPNGVRARGGRSVTNPLLFILHSSPRLRRRRFTLSDTPFNLRRPIHIALVKPEVEWLIHINMVGSVDTKIVGQRCVGRRSTSERSKCKSQPSQARPNDMLLHDRKPFSKRHTAPQTFF